MAKAPSQSARTKQKAKKKASPKSKLEVFGIERILEKVANGTFYSEIASEIGVARGTLVKWLEDNHPDLYARAREARADKLAEDILEIADDGRRDYEVGEDGRAVVDHDHIQRSKLRVDSRKWLASKMFPKRYGDKVQVGGAGDLPPLEVVTRIELVPLSGNSKD